MNDHDFNSRRLNINGVETEVLEIGTGTPLVFMHGTGTFTGFEMAGEWAKTHRVIIPYHPNFGRSGDREDYTSSTDYVLHYLDLLDARGLDRVDLAGFSLGGWIAAELALCQPDRVAHLVLVAPAGLVDPAAPAPDLFSVPANEVPALLAHDPSRIMRFFPADPDSDFDAALGREMGSLARLLSADPQGNPALGRWLHRLTHQPQLQRMGHGLRRHQDDHRTPRSAHPPLPYPGDRQRQLPLQGQLRRSNPKKEGDQPRLDPSMTPSA